MGGGSLASLFHHFLPEISITLKDRGLISGTAHDRRNRGSVSSIGSKNRKWNLGELSGFLTLRKE
jgi:hypothetical protein